MHFGPWRCLTKPWNLVEWLYLDFFSFVCFFSLCLYKFTRWFMHHATLQCRAVCSTDITLFRVTVWKTWKCQGIWQLSGKCQGLYYKSGKCQGKILSSKSGLKLFIVSCLFVSVLDFAELVHFILVSYHALLHSYFHTPTPLTITLVPAGYENTLHGQECCEPSGKCRGIVREFHIVWRVVTLVIIFYSLEHCVKRPLNPSSASRSTRCMPSVFRKICRAFSVLCPLLNIRVQTIYF